MNSEKALIRGIRIPVYKLNRYGCFEKSDTTKIVILSTKPLSGSGIKEQTCDFSHKNSKWGLAYNNTEFDSVTPFTADHKPVGNVINEEAKNYEPASAFAFRRKLLYAYTVTEAAYNRLKRTNECHGVYPEHELFGRVYDMINAERPLRDNWWNAVKDLIKTNYPNIKFVEAQV